MSSRVAAGAAVVMKRDDYAPPWPGPSSLETIGKLTVYQPAGGHVMKIKQIYHIGLPCNDLERAVKFYTEVLGMKCTKIGYDTESGGPYREKYGMFPNIARLFMEDGMCLVLFQRPATVQRDDFDEGTSHLALEVGAEDFDKAADELKKAGVKVLIDQPVVRPTGKAIYFFDTEQNYIQLWARP
jgi:catechol 2,3-dioxygenase-like lactoylglutathione lyase family enzyme